MAQETILFRASGFGALMTEGKGSQFTPENAERISELEYERDNLLNKNGNKIKWTTNKQEELDKLITKRDAPPQLSETAKRFVEEMWLLNKKGFYEGLDNRYIGKGLHNEEDGIELVSEVEGNFYIKNTERVTKGNLTGEADIVTEIDGKRIIKDIKSSWNPKTFMNGDLSNLYEYQGRCYLLLYDAEEFHLHYTLTDCPPHLFENEVWKLKNRYGIIDIEDEDVKPIFEQLRRNLIFSDNSAYTKEERVKTFVIKRDREIELKMLEKLPMAVEYYNSITLNQK